MAIFQVRVSWPERNEERVIDVRAATLREALAREMFAQGTEALVTIPAEEYTQAKSEGIQFNQADGMPMDCAPYRSAPWRS